ncbi:MAG: efflux RND transporter periplasmic adaptor subunit [Chitinophagaceae bacterium]|nr:MAG: efflux RND transporter periplasmic adaptor subunit [Chitinophagaceae bacterium]
MQRIANIAMAAAVLVLLASCGGGAKDPLAKKKEELEKLKKEQQETNDKVAKLTAEIVKEDPTYAEAKAKLVALTTVGTDTFTHFIDLQGKVDAQNVAMVSPRGMGGVVRSIHVKQGQTVRKGQLILTVDNELARQQVVAAQANIAGLESQVKLLESVYERQQNLWKNNIGTEVQVLQARTNADNAQAQLNAARAQVKLAQETAGQANVTAEISGTIDVVNVRVGESFSAASAGNPATGIRIVNTGDLKVLVQVPENYISRVQVGTNLRITLPELNNRVINSKVSVAGKLIDPATRSFFVEAKLPNDAGLRPNQVALAQIQDYAADDAITIPVNTLQNDEQGKFVMVAATENKKMVARKKPVQVGEIYRDKLEIKSGLAVGDKVISEGFQGLFDGQSITTAAN